MTANAEEGVPATPGRRPYLGFLVWLRAVAIVLVVAGHCYGLAGVHPGTFLDNTLSVLVKGGTALFVFISGFVFHYVFGARYTYWGFLRARATALAVPYCLLTLVAGILFFNWAAGGGSAKQVVRFILLGEVFVIYWYIPFILLMFVFSPLHRLFMGLRLSHQISVLIVGAALAGLVQRPVGSNPLHSVLFYLPVYLSGTLLSMQRERVLPVLRQQWPTWLLAALLLAGFQGWFGQWTNLQQPFLTIHRFELMGLQKVALGCGLVGLFATFTASPPRAVSVVADTSFAIFFLHPFVLRLMKGTTTFRLTGFPWPDLVVATAAVIVLCVLAALVVRFLFGARSKYLVGY